MSKAMSDLDHFLAHEKAAKKSNGFFSSYDNGWERGFVFKPEESNVYTVYRYAYSGGAGGELAPEMFDSVEEAMIFLARCLVLEISHQCSGGNPTVNL